MFSLIGSLFDLICYGKLEFSVPSVQLWPATMHAAVATAGWRPDPSRRTFFHVHGDAQRTRDHQK